MAIESGMKCHIVSKAAKTAVVMKDSDIDIDPDGDVASMKLSDGSWMSAMNDVKKGNECIAAVLEEKNSLLLKEMNLHHLWKL